MYSLLVQDLLHRLVRNKVPSFFLQNKQSIMVHLKPTRKPCGSIKSSLNLVFINSIQLHFGVIIKVTFSYVKIHFSINVWNTLNSTYTSSESSFMIVFLKCSTVQPMIRYSISLQRLSQKWSLPKFDPCLEFKKVIIQGGYALMHPSFSYCVTFLNPSILSQVVLKGGC